MHNWTSMVLSVLTILNMHFSFGYEPIFGFYWPTKDSNNNNQKNEENFVHTLTSYSNTLQWGKRNVVDSIPINETKQKCKICSSCYIAKLCRKMKSWKGEEEKKNAEMLLNNKQPVMWRTINGAMHSAASEVALISTWILHLKHPRVSMMLSKWR